MDKGRIWKILLGLVILVVVVVAIVKITSRSREIRGQAIQALEKHPAGQTDLGILVIANYHEYRDNSVLWSFAYFGCVFGSAFASALAGVVLKLDVLKDRPTLKNDSAAALAATAALLVTLSTSGDFQRKWQTNRIAADAMENLSYDLLAKPVDSAEILKQIKAINEARSEGVVGKGRATTEATADSKGEDKPKEPPPPATQ